MFELILSQNKLIYINQLIRVLTLRVFVTTAHYVTTYTFCDKTSANFVTTLNNSYQDSEIKSEFVNRAAGDSKAWMKRLR